MNNRFNNWLTIIITGIVGIFFIVCYKEADLFSWLVRALGLCLVLPGLYVLIESAGNHQGNRTVTVTETEIETDGRKRSGITTNHGSATTSLLIVSVCTILLGLWMLIAPGFFVGLLCYVFAAILILYGIYQIVGVVYAMRPASLPWQFYIVPSLFIIAGLLILVPPVKTINSTVTLITGILLVVSAINATIQRLAIRSYNKKLTAHTAKTTDSQKEIQQENS